MVEYGFMRQPQICFDFIENLVNKNKEHNLVEIICIEELSELQKELTKILRGNGNIDRMTEEITDVYITIAQLMTLYGILPSSIEFQARKIMNRMNYPNHK